MILDGSHPDSAVAIGACWYGNVALGNAIRIKAGSPHSYYVGVESSMPAIPGFSAPLQGLCVVPFNMEEGTETKIPYTGLGLVVGETTEFRFFSSSTRKEDQQGQLLDHVDSQDVVELPELTAELPVNNTETPPGTLVPITLKAILTEIGTLQLWCLEENGDHRWKLEYELRGNH